MRSTRTQLRYAMHGLLMAGSLCSLASAQVGSVTPQPIPKGKISVALLSDDGVTSVAGVPVTIRQGSSSANLRTNSAGYADDLSVRTDRAVTLTLGESVQPWGQSVGQKFSIVPNSITNGSGNLRVSYFQVQARTVSFDPWGSAWDGISSRWRAEPETPGAFGSFVADVAALPTRETVDNYHQFKAVTAASAELAILLRVTADVDLGSSGLLVTINVDGHGFIGSPTTSTEYIGSSPSGGSFVAKLREDNKTAVTVQVSGLLGAGDNLVLLSGPVGAPLRAPDGAGASASTDLSQEITTSLSRCGRNALAAGSVPDCEPVAPDCSTTATCEPPQPTTDTQCPDGPLAPTTGTHSSNKVGSKVCSGPGATTSSQECVTYKGGVSATGKAEGGGVGISVTVSGEVSGSKCTTVTATPGYCAQAYHCMYKASRLWEASIPGLLWGCNDFLASSYCISDGGIKTPTCP